MESHCYDEHHIFQHLIRIYRERDLQILFDKALELNTKLNRQRVEEVISELKAELNVKGNNNNNNNNNQLQWLPNQNNPTQTNIETCK